MRNANFVRCIPTMSILYVTTMHTRCRCGTVAGLGAGEKGLLENDTALCLPTSLLRVIALLSPEPVTASSRHASLFVSEAHGPHYKGLAQRHVRIGVLPLPVSSALPPLHHQGCRRVWDVIRLIMAVCVSLL